MNPDITTYSPESLKSLAYDILVQIEALNSNLRIINGEIQKRNQEPKTTSPATSDNKK